MAGRYIITGVQIGMLTALKNSEDRKKLLNEIMDKQYVGHSHESIEKDVQDISEKSLWGRKHA